MQLPEVNGGDNPQKPHQTNINNCRKITIKALQILSLIAFTVGLALIFFNPGTLSLLGIIGALDVIVIGSCIGVSFLVTLISFLMFLVVTIVDCYSKKPISSPSNSSNVKNPKLNLNDGVFGIKREGMNCGFNAILQCIFNSSDIMRKVEENCLNIEDAKEEENCLNIEDAKEEEMYKWLKDNYKVYKKGDSVDSQKFREKVAKVNGAISSKNTEEIDVPEAIATLSKSFCEINICKNFISKKGKVLSKNLDKMLPWSVELRENSIIGCLKDSMFENMKDLHFFDGILETRIASINFMLKENPSYLDIQLKRYEHISNFKTITNVKGHNRRVFIDGIEYVRAIKNSSEGKDSKKRVIYENYFISIYEEIRRKRFSNANEKLLQKHFPELEKFPKKYDIQDINGEEMLFLNSKKIEKEIKVENGYGRRKISKQIEVPLELEIKKDTHSLAKDDTYDLKFFIVHYGNINSGHYIAYVKIGENWYECNDESVSKKDISSIEKEAKQAYFIRYKKR